MRERTRDGGAGHACHASQVSASQAVLAALKIVQAHHVGALEAQPCALGCLNALDLLVEPTDQSDKVLETCLVVLLHGRRPPFACIMLTGKHLNRMREPPYPNISIVNPST